MLEKKGIRKNMTKVAILDLYDGHANEGMRNIKEIITEFGIVNKTSISYEVFDIRGNNQAPDLNFDVYISTGGPGSPIESEGSRWEKSYFKLMEAILEHNEKYPDEKKYVFLICHSFQIFCRHYELGTVCKRKSTSFGVFPIHRTEEAANEPFFENLENPFWGVDSRDWQVIQPDDEKIAAMNGQILCIEKDRPHVPLERAVMAIRFGDAIFGTQFHPEADPVGMLHYLLKEEKRNSVIENHGQQKYDDMILHLNDPDKILLTHKSIIPKFLETAINSHQTA